jgi:hypothetical protein
MQITLYQEISPGSPDYPAVRFVKIFARFLSSEVCENYEWTPTMLGFRTYAAA